MASLASTIKATIQSTKTYELGLLQTKAYRVLKQYTDTALLTVGITSTEWAFLGVLYTNSKGIRASDIAESLGVEAPFVTVLVKKLEDREFIQITADAHDNRAKLFSLTIKGTTFVDDTEKYLRGKMRPLLSGASVTDIISYALVLTLILKNTDTH